MISWSIHCKRRKQVHLLSTQPHSNATVMQLFRKLFVSSGPRHLVPLSPSKYVVFLLNSGHMLLAARLYSLLSCPSSSSYPPFLLALGFNMYTVIHKATCRTHLCHATLWPQCSMTPAFSVMLRLNEMSPTYGFAE